MIAARPALYREILARQLAGEPDIHVSGLARDEGGILSVLKRDSVRVLLLDYEGLSPNAEALLPKQCMVPSLRRPQCVTPLP